MTDEKKEGKTLLEMLERRGWSLDIAKYHNEEHYRWELYMPFDIKTMDKGWPAFEGQVIHDTEKKAKASADNWLARVRSNFAKPNTAAYLTPTISPMVDDVGSRWTVTGARCALRLKFVWDFDAENDYWSKLLAMYEVYCTHKLNEYIDELKDANADEVRNRLLERMEKRRDEEIERNYRLDKRYKETHAELNTVLGEQLNLKRDLDEAKARWQEAEGKLKEFKQVMASAPEPTIPHDVQELRKKCHEATQKLIQSEKQIRVLRDNMVEAQNLAQNRQLKIDEIDKALEERKSFLKRALEDCKKFREERFELEKKAKNLEVANKELEEERVRQNALYVKLNNLRFQEVEDRDKKIKYQKESMANGSEAREELHRCNDILGKKNKDLEDKVSKHENYAKKIEAENAELRKELAEAKAEIEFLRDEINMLKIPKKLEKINASLVRENDDLQKEVGEAKAEIARLRELVNNLQREADEEALAVSKSDGETIHKLKNENADIYVQLKKAEDQANANFSEIVRLRKVREDMRGRMWALRSENEMLEDKIAGIFKSNPQPTPSDAPEECKAPE